MAKHNSKSGFKTYSQMGPLKKTAMIILFALLFFYSLGLGESSTGPAAILLKAAAALSFFGLLTTVLSLLMVRRKKSIPVETVSEKPKIPVPQVQKKTAAPQYQALLNKLKKSIEDVQHRQNAVEELIDNSFGQSMISADRYKQVMNNAVKALNENYSNAKQAVAIFGDTQPTKARLEILEKYVKDSEDIVSSMDRVIDSLIALRQNTTLEDGDLLDERLEELAGTTIYYQKQQH